MVRSGGYGRKTIRWLYRDLARLNQAACLAVAYKILIIGSKARRWDAVERRVERILLFFFFSLFLFSRRQLSRSEELTRKESRVLFLRFNGCMASIDPGWEQTMDPSRFWLFILPHEKIPNHGSSPILEW